MNGIPAHAKIIMLTLICALSSTACANNDKVSRSQAQQLWRALATQSDPANPSVIMGVPEDSSCPQGGQQNKRMSLLSVRGDSLQMRAALQYKNCMVGSTQFDGELFVGVRSGSAPHGSITATYYEGTLTGELVVPGRVPTRCAVDLASTRAMTGNQPAKYTGTFCGYDAATLGI